jgi:ATP-dependent DNA ligase
VRHPAAFVTPMAAQVVKQLPEGPEWLYELKLDGYRALVLKNQQRFALRSRKNKDLAGMYPAIAHRCQVGSFLTDSTRCPSLMISARSPSNFRS